MQVKMSLNSNKNNHFPDLTKQSKRACQSMSATLTGFLLMAPPTARTALGFPAISARRLYETVSPNFTSLRSTCSTWLVKASSPQSRGQRGRGGRREERMRESSSFNQSNSDSWLRGWWQQDNTWAQRWFLLFWNKLVFQIEIKSLTRLIWAVFHHVWSHVWGPVPLQQGL